MSKHSEKALAAAAEEALGGEEVLGAGLFALAAELPSDVFDEDGADVPGGKAGRAVASWASKVAVGDIGFAEGRELAEEKGWADSMGLSQFMLVAVTATTVHVFTWRKDAVVEEVEQFDRASTDVHVSRFMCVEHFVELHEPGTDHRIRLIGYTGPIPQGRAGFTRKADKVVLALLTGPDAS